MYRSFVWFVNFNIYHIGKWYVIDQNQGVLFEYDVKSFIGNQMKTIMNDCQTIISNFMLFIYPSQQRLI